MAVPCLSLFFVGAIICGHNRCVPQQDLDKDNTRRLRSDCVHSIRVCDGHRLESPFLPHLLPNAQLLLR